ncbi:MAG TPA: MFS transporter [Actinomycetes bacterium]|nr:MFS transporter [Actinomycetes bacterium]
MALPRSLGSLAERPFRVYFVGRTVSLLGSAITPLALTFAALELGASAGQLGLVLGASAVPKLIFILLGGVFGDRFERRRILIVTDLVMGASQAVAAVLLLAGTARIWHLIALQLVTGTAAAFFAPASTGVVRDVVSEPRLQQANALLGMSQHISGLVGPAIAGALVALASPGWAFGIDAITFVVSAIALSRIPASFGRMVTNTSLIRDLVDGWREFSSRTWVWAMVLSFGAYQATVLPAIYLLGPVLAEEELGGAAAWAAILTGRSAGALAVGLVLLRWRPGRPLVASTLLILLDVPFLVLLGLGASLPVLVLTGAISMAAVIGADTIWVTTLQEQVPEHALSRVSSYDWLGSLAINPLGFALVGVLAAGYGAGPVLAVIVVLHVLIHLVLLATPAIRAVGRPEAEVATTPVP